jgi:hypothetical protein
MRNTSNGIELSYCQIKRVKVLKRQITKPDLALQDSIVRFGQYAHVPTIPAIIPVIQC